MKKVPGLSLSEVRHHRPFYDVRKASAPILRYVLWIDLMGSRNMMLRSVARAAIPLMKLHVAALEARKSIADEVELYPMIDGLYAISRSFSPIRRFVGLTFQRLVAEFLTSDNKERFAVRGGLAYGPVLRGADSMNGAPEALVEPHYWNAILIGIPLAQAYRAEKKAPPFGVYIDESARAFAPPKAKPIPLILWRWWEGNEKSENFISALTSEIEEYFEWCMGHTADTGYRPKRIEAHRKLGHEYFISSGDDGAIDASQAPRESKSDSDSGG